MNSPSVKTRFAPSPTGRLHLGSARTALFNWLWARREQGSFLLRVEDSDAARGHERYDEALRADLRWLHLEWDEGPEVGGPAGPYVQSQRGDLYRRHFARLEAEGRAYACFCSESELKLERKAQLAAGRPPRYSGRCRGLSADEVQARRARGAPATLRFRVDEARVVEFEDRVRGPQRFAAADIGDFVVRRSDGTPAFFFCNAVDDALMGVTLVLRGEDHLANTPRQILLLEALGLRAPAYGHIPLVVGPDGAPLSKRSGSRSVAELREEGWLPDAIANYLARLGHTYDDPRLLPFAELAARFALARVHHSPARFDEAQLRYWQREAVRHASGEALWEWMEKEVQELVPQEKRKAFVECMRGNISFPRHAKEWARVLFGAEAIEITDKQAKDLLSTAAQKDLFQRFLAAMDAIGWNARKFGTEFPLDLAPKRSFPFVRAALTNRVKGPEMWRLLDLLGERRVRARLKAAEPLLGSFFAQKKDEGGS